MALSARFSASERVGDGILGTTFTDSSTGSIVSRKWVMGDGTVYDGNSTSVDHVYWSPGKYTVKLIVDDGTDLDTEEKDEYIVVNQYYTVPDFTIMQSMDNETGEYWKFYIDEELKLVYETESMIYRSTNAITSIRTWTLVEFHIINKEMYRGNEATYRVKVTLESESNSSPISVTESKVEIAPETRIKIDELKIWSVEKDLSEYFSSTRPKAAYLDR